MPWRSSLSLSDPEPLEALLEIIAPGLEARITSHDEQATVHFLKTVFQHWGIVLGSHVIADMNSFVRIDADYVGIEGCMMDAMPALSKSVLDKMISTPSNRRT